MWNHRVVRIKSGDSVIHKVAEVYYDEYGLPWAFSRADALHSSDFDNDDALVSIADQLNDMMEATRRPVLVDPDDFTGRAPVVEPQ